MGWVEFMKRSDVINYYANAFKQHGFNFKPDYPDGWIILHTTDDNGNKQPYLHFINCWEDGEHDDIYFGEIVTKVFDAPIVSIHFDFSTGKEVSWIECKKLIESGNKVYTHVPEVLNMDWNSTIVINKYGCIIDKHELMANTSDVYTVKEMRYAHNLAKMLIAGSFDFKRILTSYE